MLDASVLPWRRAEGDGVRVLLYVVTGRHGPLPIPGRYCKECDLFYRAAREAAEAVDREVTIDVRSFWTRPLYPLLHGGWHPPVLLVDGEVIAQGYDVPSPDRVRERIEAAGQD